MCLRWSGFLAAIAHRSAYAHSRWGIGPVNALRDALMATSCTVTLQTPRHNFSRSCSANIHHPCQSAVRTSPMSPRRSRRKNAVLLTPAILQASSVRCYMVPSIAVAVVDPLRFRVEYTGFYSSPPVATRHNSTGNGHYSRGATGVHGRHTKSPREIRNRAARHATGQLTVRRCAQQPDHPPFLD